MGGVSDELMSKEVVTLPSGEELCPEQFSKRGLVRECNDFSLLRVSREGDRI